jgi:hypothetical protein
VAFRAATDCASSAADPAKPALGERKDRTPPDHSAARHKSDNGHQPAARTLRRLLEATPHTSRFSFINTGEVANRNPASAIFLSACAGSRRLAPCETNSDGNERTPGPTAISRTRCGRLARNSIDTQSWNERLAEVSFEAEARVRSVDRDDLEAGDLVQLVEADAVRHCASVPRRQRLGRSVSGITRSVLPRNGIMSPGADASDPPTLKTAVSN